MSSKERKKDKNSKKSSKKRQNKRAREEDDANFEVQERKKKYLKKDIEDISQKLAEIDGKIEAESHTQRKPSRSTKATTRSSDIKPVKSKQNKNPPNPVLPAPEWNRVKKQQPKAEPEKPKISHITHYYLQQLLDQLINHPSAFPFLEPVDAQKLGLMDYHQIIKHPMDLSTVQYNLKDNTQSYTSEQFISDVRLIWTNAMLYNPSHQSVHKMAKELSHFFEKKLQALMNLEKQDPNKQKEQLLSTAQHLEKQKKALEEQKRQIELNIEERLAAEVDKSPSLDLIPMTPTSGTLSHEQIVSLQKRVNQLEDHYQPGLHALICEAFPHYEHQNIVEIEIESIPMKYLQRIHSYIDLCHPEQQLHLQLQTTILIKENDQMAIEEDIDIKEIEEPTPKKSRSENMVLETPPRKPITRNSDAFGSPNRPLKNDINVTSSPTKLKSPPIILDSEVVIPQPPIEIATSPPEIHDLPKPSIVVPTEIVEEKQVELSNVVLSSWSMLDEDEPTSKPSKEKPAQSFLASTWKDFREKKAEKTKRDEQVKKDIAEQQRIRLQEEQESLKRQQAEAEALRMEAEKKAQQLKEEEEAKEAEKRKEREQARALARAQRQAGMGVHLLAQKEATDKLEQLFRG